MSALEVFSHGDWSVRTEVRDGEPWFVAADVERLAAERGSDTHACQSVEWDGGEYVPCRRTDTRHHGVGVWLCPEHSNTHRRHG